MKFTTLGNKKQVASCTVKNVDSITLSKGAPCFLKPNTAGTLGLDVITDTSLADASQGFFFGIAGSDISATRFGDAINFGIVDVRVILATRSATSAVWASYSAGASGDIMQFSTAVIAQAVSRSGAGSASNQFWLIQLATTYASATTSASTLGSGLFSTTLLKCMIRSM